MHTTATQVCNHDNGVQALEIADNLVRSRCNRLESMDFEGRNIRGRSAK